MKGATVCRVHGGSAPQVKRAAQVRLLMAADRVAALLLQIAEDTTQPAAVRLVAIRDVLDRAGLNAKQTVELEIEVPAWQAAMENAAKPGAVSIDWAEFLPQPLAIEASKAQPATRPRRPSGDVIVAEIVEDDEPRGVDGRSEADHRAARRAALDASRKSHPTPRRRPNA